MKLSLLSAVVMTVSLTGCTLIPDYQRPASPVDQQWPQGVAYPQGEQGAYINLGWKDYFTNPSLQQLIQVALDNNRDLRIAALNVEAYQAQYRIQRSELFPQLNVSGSGSRQFLPKYVNQTDKSAISSQYSVTAGITQYELDFFGRIRSLNENALQQYFATEQARNTAQMSLVASVANAWLTWQADQALLKLTEETLASNEATYTLTKRSNEVGVASSLDLAQARTTVEDAKAKLATYQRQVAQDKNQLVLLLGTDIPKEVLATEQDALLKAPYVKEIPVGLPSDLLQNRPDIIEAEHKLLAANANIGAARAAFFPSISLTSNAGTMSASFSNLFDDASGTWLFQPTINLPIFTAGRLSANLDYATLQKDINVANYEKTIQTAFSEVANGLAARKTYKDQVEAQANLVEANQTYYNLAEQRYLAGVDSYMTLLDAQRSLFASQQGLINVRLARLATEIDLYKTLGGGWKETTDQNTQQVAKTK